MSERKQTFKNSANNFNTTCKSIFPGAASDLLLTRSFTNSEQSKCSSLKWKASNIEIFTLLLIYGVSFLGLNGLNIIFKEEWTMYTKYSKLALISFSFKNGDVFIITDSLERADIKISVEWHKKGLQLGSLESATTLRNTSW